MAERQWLAVMAIVSHQPRQHNVPAMMPAPGGHTEAHTGPANTPCCRVDRGEAASTPAAGRTSHPPPSSPRAFRCALLHMTFRPRAPISQDTRARSGQQPQTRAITVLQRTELSIRRALR